MKGMTTLVLSATLLLVPHGDQLMSADQNVVVVLDDSGSMDDRMRTAQGRVRRIDAAKNALLEVLTKLPENTNVGVLALNTKVNGSNWIIPFGPANSNQLLHNINRIQADGGTPLGEFMKHGADELLKARSGQIYGSYRLLIVTDGEANDPELVERYLPDILSRGFVTDVIGVDMQSEHSLATRVHNYRRADDDQALQQAISEVFAETSTEDQDAAADFEMLAALPDEFAEQALKALSSAGNQPIKGHNVIHVSEPSQRTTKAPQVALGGLVCCFAVFAGVAVLVVGLIISVRKPPRRR